MSKLGDFANAVSGKMYQLDGGVKSAISAGEARAYAMRAAKIGDHNSDKVTVTGEMDSDYTAFEGVRDGYIASFDSFQEQILGNEAGVGANFAAAKTYLSEEQAEFAADLDAETVKINARVANRISELGSTAELEAAFNAVFGA